MLARVIPAPTLLARQLLLVTGKGGVGKTTVAAALGAAAAARGRRTIVCEVGAQARLPRLFGRERGDDGTEVELEENLWAVSIDPQRALEEWFATIIGRPATALLARSNTFGYFVAAAPGARELVTITKVWELAQRERWDRHAQGFDLVVVDAPATGHALGMLRTPRSYATIARVGPIARQAGQVRDFLADPRASALIAVATPSEMPVAETLELGRRLREDVGRELEAVVANGVLTHRFDEEALLELATAIDGDRRHELRAAARAVLSERARVEGQSEQLERLRDGVGAPVVELPFVFSSELGLRGVRRLASALSAQLA